MPRDPSDTSPHPGPGGYQPGPQPEPSPIGPIVATFKQQVFRITCRGMKPNTVHKFYYEGVERGKDCIAINPKPGATVLGSPLKTDEEGKIEFRFYFTLNVEQRVDEINKVKYDPAGDKKFELIAVDSTAAKVVPMTVTYVSPPPPPPPDPSRRADGIWRSK